MSHGTLPAPAGLADEFHIFSHTVTFMHYTMIRLFIILSLCCLPTFVAAASTCTIDAEMTDYAPIVMGFQLDQEGRNACHIQNPKTTSTDCVSLTADTVNLMAIGLFSVETQNLQSFSSDFKMSLAAPLNRNPSMHTEYEDHIAPSGYTTTRRSLYKEGALACQTLSANTSLDCTLSRASDTLEFTQSAVFNDGTESPHPSPLIFTLSGGSTSPLQAVNTNNSPNGTAPYTFEANTLRAALASHLWGFGDGSTASGMTSPHTTAAGTYIAELNVTNTSDQRSASTGITVTAPIVSFPPAACASFSATIDMTSLTDTFGSTGATTANNGTVRTTRQSSFQNPIVFFGLPNRCLSAARIPNVSRTEFKNKMAGRDDKNGMRPASLLNYMVLEKQRTSRPGGSILHAGSFTGTTNFKTVPFKGAFALPVTVTTVASGAEVDA